MRRLMLALALIGASALFLGAPGTASAGECTTQVGVVGLTSSPLTNYFGYQAWCTGYIDKIELNTVAFYGPDGHGGMSYGCVSCFRTAGVRNTVAQGGGQSNLGVTAYFCAFGDCGGPDSNFRFCTAVFSPPPGSPNNMAGYVYFRIHQVSTNSWGPYHVATGSSVTHYVAC